jgi:ankyrin repeat protein
MWAAMHRHVEMVRLLLHHKAKVNARSTEEGKYTALLLALTDEREVEFEPYEDEARRAEVVRLLLDRGANPNVQNFMMISPLYLALSGKSTRIVRLLLEHDARTTKVIGGLDADLLEVAAMCENEVIVRWMLKRKPSFKVRKRAAVAAFQNEKITRLLMETFKEPEERREVYTELLQGSVHSDANLATTKLLIEQGANVNVQEKTGLRTPLIEAVDEGALETIRYLLSKGADKSLKLWNGLIALDHAKLDLKGTTGEERKKWEEIIRLLEQ